VVKGARHGTIAKPSRLCLSRAQVALLRNYTNGLTALVQNLKGQKQLGKQVGGGAPGDVRTGLQARGIV
jgi:hypothetical protein